MWATGPGEILRHGVALLADDTDTNRRLAMISIDNAVELTMQTFIQLPKRITGIDVSRKERDEICSNFPNLLDGIEKHASEKIIGINLGEIEWFHRLRNELYHQGNGLTVERQKVEVYAELAGAFFAALFDVKLEVDDSKGMQLLGQFLNYWVQIEAALSIANKGKKGSRGGTFLQLIDEGVVTEQDFDEFRQLSAIRNDIVHSPDGQKLISKEVVRSAKRFSEILSQAYPDPSK